VNRRATDVLRLAGRLALLVAGSCTFVLVAVQFEGIVAKNVAMVRAIDASRAEIRSLEARERDQARTLHRLATPAGAIPEIHDKLRLVGPHEEIIYLRGPAPAAQPEAGAR
jgi:hypothetical protein